LFNYPIQEGCVYKALLLRAGSNLGQHLSDVAILFELDVEPDSPSGQLEDLDQKRRFQTRFLIDGIAGQ
jgi:hypothetical protein